MKVLVISTSRADFGGLEAVNNELMKHGVESKFVRIFETPPDNRSDVVYNTTDTMLFTRNKIEEYEPDMVLICGDRYETLGVATATYLMQVPIAHLSGGDITEGSQDDCMRHALTKLAHLHFPTCNKSAKRLVQLGESPGSIYIFGCPHSDIEEVSPLTTVNELYSTDLKEHDYLLVVWHPNTLVSEDEAFMEVHVLSEALDKVNKKKLVIGPNNDAGNAKIKEYWPLWAKLNNQEYRNEVPRDVYLSLLKHCTCLVGNSSSGFYEAPYLGTPVVNIGDRQEGRIPVCGTYMSMIYSDEFNVKAIVKELNWALKLDRSKIVPVKKDNSAKAIASAISKIENPKSLLKKVFYDL